MLKTPALALLFLCCTRSAMATFLYVSSYSGIVTTLNLTLPSQNASLASTTLESVSSSTGCAQTPSWLTLDATNGVLYCLDRGSSTVSGSLSSFQVANDGSLSHLDRVDMIYGAVSSVIYGDTSAGLAVAH